MSKKPLTLARFEALPDTQKDACVALAMGWEQDTWLWARAPECRKSPPPYFTAAGPDRWKWWGEMIDALCKAQLGIAFAHSQATPVPGCVIPEHWSLSDYAGGVTLGELTDDTDTLGHALVRALCAAGKLEENADVPNL